MATNSVMYDLQLDRAGLKRQIDGLMVEMREAKGQRQALEKAHEEAQLHLHAMTSQGDAEGVKVATAQVDEIERALLEIQEAVPNLSQRMTSLQREHGLALGAINRCKNEAANVANRIRLLRSDLERMQRKQDVASPVVQNAIQTIRKDLKISEDKHVGLTGEVLPHDEAA